MAMFPLVPFACLVLFAVGALAVQTIVIKGSDLVNAVTGNRFQIVGVAYQPGGSSGYNPGSGVDPLSDASVCLRDAALMQRLGINAIRVYNVDPSINHDACASIFNAVGVYMLVDVNSPLAGENIDRSAPWESYYVGYVNRTFAVVEAFKSYPNTLLFFSGNEVINDLDTGKAVPPYMRAITRDLKNYIAKHSKRSIPVGYSAADVREILLDTWNYLQCTTTGNASDPSRVDVFALNSYSWCGDSTFQTAQYDVLVSNFANTSVQVFFSEYGCNVPSPRVFTEVPVLYGPLVTPVLSGGLVYEYSEEPSNYGLVTLNSDGSADLLRDYETLQKQFSALNATSLQSQVAGNTTTNPPNCTASLITNAGFSNNFTIPAVPPGVQDLIDNGIKNAPVGKIIAVTSTKVTQQVKSSNGEVVQNLAITPLRDDESNTPQVTPTTTTTTSSAPAATTSKKNSGLGNAHASSTILVSAVILAIGWTSLL
ncbi:beta-glucanosyltransferase gel2 [Diplocarpon rosae]|nr:beta-glucanosyltransferase gel2 [Diplocarpon rosae]